MNTLIKIDIDLFDPSKMDETVYTEIEIYRENKAMGIMIKSEDEVSIGATISWPDAVFFAKSILNMVNESDLK